jgi:hypothetical protein
MRFRVEHLDEPLLEFGSGKGMAVKEGLAEYGPYSLRLGTAHPRAVNVGIVGTRASIRGARSFLERAGGNVSSGGRSAILAPEFPGFPALMHSDLGLDPRWSTELSEEDVNGVLAQKPQKAFQDALQMWIEAIHDLARRDVRPDVILCAIPRQVLDRCAHIERPRRRRGSGRTRGRRVRVLKGQLSLLDTDAASIESVSQPRPEDLASRNFRRALKAAAMDANVPIQIVTPNLYEEGLRGQQDPATRSWNLSVALFYKAGGIPWRVQPEAEHTCFVGISFHHLYTQDDHVVYSSLAQAFSSDADGFALRGDAMPWDAEGRRPSLGEEEAFELLRKVVSAYRDRIGRDPLRLVVHKTSEFTSQERTGIQRALSAIPAVELHTIRSTELRLIRQGSYPPHRGTLCHFGSAAFLFSTGYSTIRETYDGPHIPAPLELVGIEPNRGDATAREVLALTKMNWNSADDHTAFPITLAFARKVGLIMSEVPSDREPHPLYRYYM